MQFEEISLWTKLAKDSVLKRYQPPDRAVRPALLVVPGGGYGCICEETEGYPIAEHFAGLGFQVFHLKYRVHPNLYPAPQQDLARAIRLIRRHADAWQVLPDQLAICGFSAGGHLCACAGTISAELPTQDGDQPDTECARPNALILCYPVITFGPFAHIGSGKNLLGERFDELAKTFSLENQVTPNTPPTFLWHTIEDQAVPYQNSLLFAEAMVKQKRPCEVHLFPSGQHGMQLGHGRKDIGLWPQMARNFLISTCGFSLDKTV